MGPNMFATAKIRLNNKFDNLKCKNISLFKKKGFRLAKLFHKKHIFIANALAGINNC
jgi:hypothetical protein